MTFKDTQGHYNCCYWIGRIRQGGHSPGKPGIVREFKSGQGKVREKRKSEGKCVLACVHLPRIMFLTKYARTEFFTRYSEEHSCHSYDSIYEYCGEK